VVRLLHLQAGFSNPLEGNFEIGLIKKGISREKGVPPVQKQPMTIAILRRMRAVLDFAKPFDLAFWTICLVVFFGFMRKSTMLPVNSLFLPGKTILRSDIVDLSIHSFSVLVRQSKVIQFGQKVHTIPFASSAEFQLCPAMALMAHFGASPLSPSRPVFNYLFAGREHLVTQQCFVVRLKSVLSEIGLNAKVYSAHSLRRGGASYAFQIGVSPLQIKLRGDWASDAFERYVYISSGATLRVAECLSRGVADL
jgi:hypothetical protein